MTVEIKSTKSASFVVKGARLWTSRGESGPFDLLVEGGVLTRITDKLLNLPQNTKIIEAAGLVILPAGVDAQVHLRVPGQPQKETPESGLFAAVSGGVGALLTMPNTKPVIDSPASCEIARRELRAAEERTGVKVLLSAAITVGQKGHELVDFEGLARCGVAAFTDDGVGVSSDELMKNALKATGRLGLPILQHAEMPGHGAVLAPGPMQAKVGGQPYIESFEVDMVKRDVRLLEEAPNARYHVLHVSSAKTLGVIEEAKRKGLGVTCEVSPHHLFFNAEDIHETNSSFKMNPPLRSQSDQLALQQALANGLCDFMATDHAPHELQSKSSNYKTSAFGTTGLETSLRVLLWMLQRNALNVTRLVEVWSSAPARFLGISDEFGDIAIGKKFNAVLVDSSVPDRVVMASDFNGLSKNSCFLGAHLPGKIHATILNEFIHEIIQ